MEATGIRRTRQYTAAGPSDLDKNSFEPQARIFIQARGFVAVRA
jgi:hypothetical protein